MNLYLSSWTNFNKKFEIENSIDLLKECLNIKDDKIKELILCELDKKIVNFN